MHPRNLDPNDTTSPSVVLPEFGAAELPVGGRCGGSPPPPRSRPGPEPCKASPGAPSPHPRAIPGKPGWFQLPEDADRYPDHDTPALAAGFSGLRYSKRTRQTRRHPTPPDRAYGGMDWPWAVAAAVIDEATSEANHGGWSVQVAESIDQELDGITSSRAVRYFDAHGWETISDVYAAAGLTERQQGIVTRRIYGGEYAVIAADVSSTPEAVRQEYRRALAELGKLLKSLDAPLPNVTPPLYTHRGADSADAVEQTRAMLDNLPSDALADLDDGEARALRETAGLSLRAVAQMIGTPPSTVARWERGARSPRPSEASRRYVALVETWRGPSVANCHRKGVTGDGTNIPPPKILSARQMRRRREREIAVEPTTLELMALDRALIDPRTPRN